MEDLIEVLEFYKPFSHTFSRNLCLTFDLSKRVVFSKVNIEYDIHDIHYILDQVSDKKLEKMFDQVQQWERPFTPNQVALLKKVVNKFKSKVAKGIKYFLLE